MAWSKGGKGLPATMEHAKLPTHRPLPSSISMEVSGHARLCQAAQRDGSSLSPHSVIVTHAVTSAALSQVEEEPRPHAARLSQAAASGTVAVYKCFAAQAHAALAGLMHIRSAPPPFPDQPSLSLLPGFSAAAARRCNGLPLLHCWTLIAA